MNALGAILGVSVGYPDADVVDQAGVRGEINNGLRGRPRVHKKTYETFVRDYQTVTTENFTADHTGKLVSFDGSTTSEAAYQ